MTRKEQAALAAVLVPAAAIMLGLWLSSNPRCRQGCQTVAEHLVKHGLQGLLRNLLA